MVSWDNREIAFTNARRTEIRLRNIERKQVRAVAAASRGATIVALAWAPDNRHVGYVERRHGDDDVSLRVVDTKTGVSRTLLARTGITTLSWLADNRIVFNGAEPAPNESSENLWELEVGPTGEVVSAPRRITDLIGFAFAMLRATADGRQISYIRWRQQSDVMTAQVLGPGRISPPRRLTQDERVDWPSSWRRDRRSILFFSDRNGALDVFEQDPEADSPTPLLSGPSDKRFPQMSADGKWLLYLDWPARHATGGAAAEGRLMRVPADGGTPQQITPISGYPGSARIVLDGYTGLRTNGHPRFRCPGRAVAPCMVSEIVGAEMVLTAFDPLRGRLGVVTRLKVDPANISFWDLSPDGTKIVAGERLESGASMTILDLEGRRVRGRRTIAIRDWNMIEDATWTPDGKALYLTAFRSKGAPLLYATLDGEATVLHTGFVLTHPSVSPDGRAIAFGEVTADSNAWMLERR